MQKTQEHSPTAPTDKTPQDWARALLPYHKADNLKATFELVVTLASFAGLWLAMLWASQVSLWLFVPLAIPTSMFLVRLFMIQHDCGHGSFFSDQRFNDMLGRFLGVLTLTPYRYWQRSHAIHHATSGNLERRGMGDITTLTLSEYRDSSAWQRLSYRLYRHPFVLFVVGPAYLFLLQFRLPVGMMRRGASVWISTLGTSLSAAALWGVLAYLVGWQTFLMIQLPAVLLAGAIGIWLFFIQHQFEMTEWDHDGEWNWHRAALTGSSFYDLPPVFRWLTANIGIHHVHHLSGRIPFYRLNKVLEDFPQLRQMSRLTFVESLGCIKLALWDEDKRRMISFQEAAA